MQFVMIFFFFNDTAPTEIYTLSLHDALPIYGLLGGVAVGGVLERSVDAHPAIDDERVAPAGPARDRKSTRLNSSHSQISYAVFCLKKKKKQKKRTTLNQILQTHQTKVTTRRR